MAGDFILVTFGNPPPNGATGYSVAFGASAGISGQTNEVIGNFAYNGVTITNANSGNPINAWGNYVLSASGPANGLLANLVCATSGMALDNGGSTTNDTPIIQEPQSGGDTN